jgi:hypothetical protein
VSVEKRTVFSIEVSEDKLPRLGILVKIPGFDAEQSNTADLADRQNYVMYTAIYNRHIGLWEKRRIKRSVKKLCGKVDIDVLRLGENPILSKDDRDMLIYCFVIAGAAATSSGGSANFLLPGKVIEASAIAGVTALATFLAELGFELRIRRNRDSR